MGKLLGIAIKQRKRGEVVKLNDARISKEYGVEGDFRGKPGDRQVTLLSSESWNKACSELGRSLEWTTRRANLFVDGLDFENATGSIIKIGDAELEITGQTEPCFRMDEASYGLRSALMPEWRGGVTCRVIKSGEARIGDEANFV